MAAAAGIGRTETDVTYCTVDGVELKMDVYYPEGAASRTPAVVYIHGGGWTSGDKTEGFGRRDIPDLIEAGFTIFSVDYRLAPRYTFPAMIEDVKCAIRSLRAHAEEYRIDPDRIGVWGSSAGGHLTGLLGLTDADAGFDVGQYADQSSRVQAVAIFFGPTDLTVPFPGGYDGARQVFAGFPPELASPITYVTPDDPPVLLVHGDADDLVPLDQSERLYEKLVAAGVEARLVVVKDGPHSLSAPHQSPSRGELTRLLVEFFREHLQ